MNTPDSFFFISGELVLLANYLYIIFSYIFLHIISFYCLNLYITDYYTKLLV